MAYSTTGFAYLALLLALGYLAYRFFQYWRKEKDIISKIFLYFAIFFGLFALIRTIGGLFFATNPSFLERIIVAGTATQTFAFAAIAYLIVYLKFPQVSPWFGFIPILILGLIAIILTVVASFNPFLELSGAINWGFPSGPLGLWISVLRFFLFAVTFIPLIIIFLQQFKTSIDSYVKGKALGISLSLLFALTASLFDFLLINILKLDSIWRDASLIILSITLFITLFLTLHHPSSKP